MDLPIRTDLPAGSRTLEALPFLDCSPVDPKLGGEWCSTVTVPLHRCHRPFGSSEGDSCDPRFDEADVSCFHSVVMLLALQGEFTVRQSLRCR